MSTSTIYNRSFWNAMRGKNAAYSDMAEGEDGRGNHHVPREFADRFTDALKKDNLFRRLATVVGLSSSPDGTIHAVASMGTAAWTQDGTPLPESADTFTQFPLKSHKLAALTRLKETFVSDTSFDMEGYLLKEFARRFGRAEEAACITGDGLTQPTGILGGGEVGATTTDTKAVTYDEIVALYISLKAEYRQNAVFLMHDETMLFLRTLKDSTGNYLWDSDDTIFGKPVLTSPHMPTMAAGAKAIAFGDLSFYWLVERQPLTAKRLSELYAREGQIGFSAFERLDGKLIRPEAVKILQMAE